MKCTIACTILTLLIAQGCAPKASFELSVTNRTDQPITVGIVKEGGSYERDLAGPEQWALESSLDSLPPWGHVIPPGKTLNSPEITGSFPRGSAAYLRIYRGQRSNAGLMAISNPSPDRLEVLLFPGYNQLIIHKDLDKGLVAQRLHPQRQQ
jgi:hypothetical protein